MEKKEKHKILSSNKKKLQKPTKEILVVIVNRGKGEEVLSYLKMLNINHQILSFGDGTASSAIANVLGLYEKKKELIMAVIDTNTSDKTLDLLEEKFLSVEKYSGIAFTIPLKSITKNSMQEFMEEDKHE